MSKEEIIKYNSFDHFDFIKYIKSIGFVLDKMGIDSLNGFIFECYEYKKFKITVYKSYYDFYSKYEYIGQFYINDLTPIEKEFKRELRSIKLKKLLK